MSLLFYTGEQAVLLQVKRAAPHIPPAVLTGSGSVLQVKDHVAMIINQTSDVVDLVDVVENIEQYKNNGVFVRNSVY